MAAKIDYIKYQDIDIPIIFEKSKFLPTFNLKLVFKNSGYIVDSKNGLVRLTTKILNNGTKKLGNTKFADLLENRAIELHTYYGFETVMIELSCLKSELNYGMDKLNTLLLDPNLTEDSLNKIKMLTISKILNKKTDFDYVSNRNLISTIFDGTKFQYSPLGTEESVKSINLDDIRTYINNYFTLENLIIVTGGDISLKEIKKVLKKGLLANIPKSGKVTYKMEHLNANKNQKVVTTIKEDTKQAYISFGAPLYIKSDSKEKYKAKVASFILGSSGFGSRLMEEIRVKQGLAYSIYSTYSINKSRSYFTGSLQTKLDKQDKAIKSVKNIINKFVKEGVTQKELDDAKDFIIGSEPLRNETLSQRLSRVFHIYYGGLQPDYIKLELEKISNLTLDELNQFIKEHKEITELTISVVTKEKN